MLQAFVVHGCVLHVLHRLVNFFLRRGLVTGEEELRKVAVSTVSVSFIAVCRRIGFGGVAIAGSLIRLVGVGGAGIIGRVWLVVRIGVLRLWVVSPLAKDCRFLALGPGAFARLVRQLDVAHDRDSLAQLGVPVHAPGDLARLEGVGVLDLLGGDGDAPALEVDLGRAPGVEVGPLARVLVSAAEVEGHNVKFGHVPSLLRMLESVVRRKAQLHLVAYAAVDALEVAGVVQHNGWADELGIERAVLCAMNRS